MRFCVGRRALNSFIETCVVEWVAHAHVRGSLHAHIRAQTGTHTGSHMRRFFHRVIPANPRKTQANKQKTSMAATEHTSRAANRQPPTVHRPKKHKNNLNKHEKEQRQAKKTNYKIKTTLQIHEKQNMRKSHAKHMKRKTRKIDETMPSKLWRTKRPTSNDFGRVSNAGVDASHFSLIVLCFRVVLCFGVVFLFRVLLSFGFFFLSGSFFNLPSPGVFANVSDTMSTAHSTFNIL